MAKAKIIPLSLHAATLYQRIVENTEAAIAVADARQPDSPLIFINAAFSALTGYSSSDVVGLNCRFLQGSESDQPGVEIIRNAIAKNATARATIRNFRKDGSMFWNDLTVAPIFDDQGALTHYFSVCMDVSRQVLRLDELEYVNQSWNSLIDASASVTYVLDHTGVVTFEGGGIGRLTGHKRGAAKGKHWKQLVQPSERERVHNVLESFYSPAREGRPAERDRAMLEISVRDTNGGDLVMCLNVSNALDHPNIRGLVIVAHDVTARVEAERQLKFDATHDTLTGLENRLGLNRRIEQWRTGNDEKHGNAFLLWLIDLDQFKALNDSRGHSVGDDYLRAIALALTQSLGLRASVSRLGGDEFCVTMHTNAPHVDHQEITSVILAAFRATYMIDDLPVRLTASVGLTIETQRQTSLDKLLGEADIALYKAKADGRNMNVMYQAPVGERTLEKLSLRRDLPQAVQSKQLHCYYQPIVDANTRKPVSFETLLRWHHPDHGVLTAQHFIDELDVLGLADQVTDQVFERTLESLGPALRAGTTRIAINLWARSLRSGDLLRKIKGVFSENNVPLSCLDLEITESDFVLSAQSTPDTLREISEAGIKIVVDDFGKGFSNFGYLLKLPVHTIKIDREFTQQLATSERHKKLVRSLLFMCRELEIETIAEGVETEAERAFYLDHGCSLQQGYLYGKAAPKLIFHCP